MAVMNNVYIAGTGRFLPNEPITNEEIESYIGKLYGKSSRLMKPVLRKNGIKTRYYAINQDGHEKYSNAQMAANAIREALLNSKLDKDDIEFLATSTTQGDLLVPGFASSVHAELKSSPLEIASFQSVCVSSLMAIKSAFNNIKIGDAKVAAVSGSEFSSRWFRSEKYEEFINQDEADRPPIETEFLRWTLSDGAGAMILSNKPDAESLQLKIDWIELKSYADKFPPCMYAGTKTNRGESNYWSQYKNPSEAAQNGAISLKQDVELLYQLFPVWVGFYLKVFEKYHLDPNSINHFIPHYSSESLGVEMKKLLSRTGTMIPEERWFNHVKDFGNTGTASIFILIDDFLKTHEVKKNDKILCFVPESGQCSAAFMMLSVV